MLEQNSNHLHYLQNSHMAPAFDIFTIANEWQLSVVSHLSHLHSVMCLSFLLGVQQHAMFMKEIEDGLLVQRRILQQLEHASYLYSLDPLDPAIDRILHWVVVGGGPTGVELTAELSDFFASDVKKYFPHLRDRVRITLVEATGKILSMFQEDISAYAERSLVEGGARVRCNAMVTSVTESIVRLKERVNATERSSLPADTISSTNTREAHSTSTTMSAATAPSSMWLESELEFGVLVWAGGISARPLTREMALTIGGPSQVPVSGPQAVRGLAVDDKLRVKDASICTPAKITSGTSVDSSTALTDTLLKSGDEGAVSASRLRNTQEQRSVFAIGDCALSGCPPTAQAAFQQGRYLGNLYNDTKFSPSLVSNYESFQLVNYGALAYVGSSRGVAELKSLLWDNHPVRDSKGGPPASAGGVVTVEGAHAFALWRSLYFSKLLSNRNKAQVITFNTVYILRIMYGMIKHCLVQLDHTFMTNGGTFECDFR